MDELAIFGGNPVRNEKIFYGKQQIDDDDIKAVINTLKSDYITCGPKVKELEEKLANITGAKYAVACSNGTAALHCACIAAGIKAGDEVIVTSLTFSASSNCILYCGATPVFVDVDIQTYNIDPKLIEEKITDKTKAIIAVDFTGQAVDCDAIRKICDKYNLVFIEDAAHSLGTCYDGKKIGSIADMTCFSFHPVKTVTCGEGGAITTNNKEYYDKLYLAHVHGIEHDPSKFRESNPEGIWYQEMQMLGYNYRLTDFQSALLINQLKKLPSFAKRRKEIVKKYDEAFFGMPELIIQKNIDKSDTVRHLYIIRLNFDNLKCSRREFFDAMSAENVQCQIHYIPVYWFPYYQDLGYKKGLCPNAEQIYLSSLSIPLYPSLTDSDVETVIKAVKKIVNHYRK